MNALQPRGGTCVDQRDQDAWLEGLAARVDAGEPIDWVAEEQRVGAEGRHVVRALRIVAEIADEARRPMETVQSAPGTQQLTQPTTEPVPTPPAPPADDEPVSDRYRSYTPSEPAEIRRKLLFGVTLLLALGLRLCRSPRVGPGVAVRPGRTGGADRADRADLRRHGTAASTRRAGSARPTA